MSLTNRGYMNKLLKIDLTRQSVLSEKLDENVMQHFLGGKGLGTYLLYRGLKAHTAPLSPDNMLILAVGPLTGTNAPTSGRFCVMCKSPATGTISDAYCGGFFGSTLKYAGYDAIVISGAASSPIKIIIDNDNVSLEDASELSGEKVQQTNIALRKKYGEDIQSVVIGPAGERLSPISGMFSGVRTAGRGGVGAVMGSKKLKAIVVRGSKGVVVADREQFEEAVWIAHRALRMSSQIKRLKDIGTANIIKLVNAAGALPTRNFQLGQFDRTDDLSGEIWRQKYWKKDIACFGCPIACSKIAFSEKYQTTIDGPDYETIFALGTNCGVYDHEAIFYGNYLCDAYGVDTISVGNIIGFVMELFQRGLATRDDFDGIEARWGDGDALVRLIEKIGKGEGVGELLQQGVRAISQHFPGSEDFAMQVKGLEMPGYLPRAAKGIGLSYAISERGACHLRGSPLSEILGGAEPLTTSGKAALFKSNQLDSTVVNTLILCYFVKFGLTLKEIFQMVTPATGFDFQHPRDLEHIGERIITLCRMFNLREGFSNKDDVLPKRSLAEPLPSGPAKGQVVDLDTMRAEYYQLMGWDEQGVPKPETLDGLGLSEIL